MAAGAAAPTMGAAAPARRAASWAAVALRAAVIVAALWMAVHIAARGTMEDPITMYDSAASTNGFYTSTHLLPVAAATLVAAGLAAILDEGFCLPVPAMLLVALLPLLAYGASAFGAVDAFDARRDVLIAAAWAAEFLALVDALAGTGRRMGPLAEVWRRIVSPRRDGHSDHPVPRAQDGERGFTAAPQPGADAPAEHPAGLPPRAVRRRSAGRAAEASGARGAAAAAAGAPGARAAPGPLRRIPALVRALTLAAVAAGGMRAAVAALRQFKSGVPTQVAWTGAAVAKYIPVRVTATFHNPNVFFSDCLLVIACGAAVSLLPGSRLWTWLRAIFGGAAVVLGTLAAVLTFSRAGYLSLLLACCVTAVLLPSGLRRQAALRVLPCVAVPFAFLALTVPGVVFRLHTIGVRSGGDVSSRFFSWLDALRVWRAHPLIGAGAGGIQALYAPFLPLGHFGTYALINVPGGIDNDVLQWLADAGLVGLAALAVAGLLWAVSAVRRWRQWRPSQRAVLAPLSAAFIGLAAQGMLETTLYNMVVLAVAVPLAAVWTAEAGLYRAHRLPWRSAWWSIVPVAAAAALALALHAPWAGDQAYLAGYAASVGGHPALAQRLLSQSASADPGAPRTWAALADVQTLSAYRERAKQPAAARTEAAGARSSLQAATELDPYDAATWDVAAVWEGLAPNRLAQACAQEWSVRDNPYDSGYVLRFAGDLQAIAGTSGLPRPAAYYRGAAVADIGYAARLLPLVLKVYTEHRYVHALASVRQAIDYASATWQAQSPAPFPRVPTLPLSAAVCGPALAATGLQWPHAKVPIPIHP